MTRDEELRIHALGAAISRRDWHATEQAHAAIRDAFHARPAAPARIEIDGKPYNLPGVTIHNPIPSA